jgi:hypothetical protein
MLCVIGLADGQTVEKELDMDDLPLWMKLPIWIIVGGTVVYAVVAMVYSAMGS